MSDLDVLNAIERLELRALRWGFADGSLSETEALAIAQTAWPGGDPDEALDALIRKRLIFEVRGPGDEIRLRSRFAETVRLLSRLRQWFAGRPWTAAPRLVSDYRLDLRGRRYPDRNLPAAEVFARVAGPSPSPLRAQLWAALTGPNLDLADFQEEASQRLLRARGDTGIIVTAGTGSGKTLAFYLRHRLLTDPDLPPEVDAFQRDWLYQSFVAAVLVRAVDDERTLAEVAAGLLEDPRADRAFAAAIAAIFQGQGVSDQPGEEGDDEAALGADDGAHSAQGQTIQDVFHRPEVRARLAVLSAEMSHPDPDAFTSWVEMTVTATTAEALLQACVSLVPRHISSDSLTIDVEAAELARLWVTESTLGGAGVLQAVFERIADEPRALFRAIEAALAPTDLELAAEGLESFVRLAHSDATVAQAVQILRAADSYDARETARQDLYTLLSARGLDVGRALSVSLNARLLTPTSGPSLDALLVDLLDRWRALEARLGLSISVREISHVFALDDDIRARTRAAAGLPQELGTAEAAQVLANLLWPRGVEVSQRALQSYNRFARRRSTDPRLTRRLFQQAGRSVTLNAAGWREDTAANTQAAIACCLAHPQ